VVELADVLWSSLEELEATVPVVGGLGSDFERNSPRDEFRVVRTRLRETDAIAGVVETRASRYRSVPASGVA
jgi:hypothetical protein